MAYIPEETDRLVQFGGVMDIETAMVQVIKKNRRTPDQNKKMWAMLRDIADQVEWHGQKLTRNDWKWIFTAAIKGQRMVPGLEGGLVYLGEPTSGMTKKVLADMIEMMYAFGAEHGVEWQDEIP